MIIPVILAGGAGTRLWPLSRQNHPKQFIPLIDQESLFQKALQRVQKIPGILSPIIITHEQHRFIVAEQLGQLNLLPASIILEPMANNTAPAAALAALHAGVIADPNTLLLILPADHLICDVNAFVNSVEQAISMAQQNYLVAFGVQPTRAETGYGYIEKGDALLPSSGFAVKQFIEKPDLVTAQAIYQQPNYLWNSGIFLVKAQRFLVELQKFSPKIYKTTQSAYQNAQQDVDFIRPDATIFNSCPADSIDYSIMEKTQLAATFKLDSDWNDIGSWAALGSALKKDHYDNSLVGKVLVQATHNCYIHANKRLVAAVGVKDLVIVETSDAILVLHKDHSQTIKQVITELQGSDKHLLQASPRVHRPWGSYELIDEGKRFQVKRITVAVGASLSLQLHHHRCEHWVVVCGTARVTRDQEIFMLSENQSTYIPIGSKHRLENVGKIPLEMIEVQSGSYLGEDDIIRFDDQYGRIPSKPSIVPTQHNIEVD